MGILFEAAKTSEGQLGPVEKHENHTDNRLGGHGKRQHLA